MLVSFVVRHLRSVGGRGQARQAGAPCGAGVGPWQWWQRTPACLVFRTPCVCQDHAARQLRLRLPRPGCCVTRENCCTQMGDGDEIEDKRTAPALDAVVDEPDLKRRLKQHDSPLSAGQDATVLVEQLTAVRVAKEAAAKEARDAVDAQRVKRDALSAEYAAAFEEPRVREKLQARLGQLEQELKRRERVAEAAAAAVASALAVEIKHRDATEAFAEIEARRREERDAMAEEDVRRIAEARRAAEEMAAKRAREAAETGLLKEGDPSPGSPARKSGQKKKTGMEDVVRLRWQAHDSQFGVFAARTPAQIRASDVPFLDLKLLQMAESYVPEEVDVKNLQQRWHPDKWLQKYGARLADQDRDDILERVNEIAVAVNALRPKAASAAAEDAHAS